MSLTNTLLEIIAKKLDMIFEEMRDHNLKSSLERPPQEPKGAFPGPHWHRDPLVSVPIRRVSDQHKNLTTRFMYANHRGKMELRTVDVDSISYNPQPGWDYKPYKPGWFLNGYCHDRKGWRSFALDNIKQGEHNPDGFILLKVPYATPR